MVTLTKRNGSYYHYHYHWKSLSSIPNHAIFIEFIISHSELFSLSRAANSGRKSLNIQNLPKVGFAPSSYVALDTPTCATAAVHDIFLSN